MSNYSLDDLKKDVSEGRIDTVLAVQAVSASSDTDADLTDVSLELRAGEIVGIAGVAGSGQNTLIDVLAGLRAPASGSLVFAGRTAPSAVELLRVWADPEWRERAAGSASPAS